MEKLLKKLAQVICHSADVKKGDKVLLQIDAPEGLPVLEYLQQEILNRGAFSYHQILFPHWDREFLLKASRKQLYFVPDWEKFQMKESDVCLIVRANNRLNLPVEKENIRHFARKEVIENRINNTHWCLTYFPTEYDAQLQKISLEECRSQYFSAVLQDYKKIQKKNLTLKRLMEKTNQIEIEAPDTHLIFSIKGIGVVSCYGKRNLPDGEVYTAPIASSVNGYVKFNTRSNYWGREWDDVFLRFEDGKVVEASCKKGKRAIEKLLNNDGGSRQVGEFAIGTNPAILVPTGNTIFDEKIFGSFHLALGQCYKQADNGNRSDIHWDLVKMMTQPYGGGTIKFDGRLIMKNGKFVKA